MADHAPTTVRLLERERDEAAVVDLDFLVWSNDHRVPRQVAANMAPWRAMLGAEREVDGQRQLVGLWGSWNLTTAVPGPLDTVSVVQVEGATWAGVHPDHRRTGVAKALITTHLERCRDAGTPVTVHLASEPTIYSHFGYACANYGVSYSLGSGVSLRLPDGVSEQADAVVLRSRLATSDGVGERALRIAQECASTQLGATFGDLTQRGAEDQDIPVWRAGAHPTEYVFASREGHDTGFARIMRTGKWEHGLPQGKLRVNELRAVDLPTLVALVRRVTSYDLMSTTQFVRRELDDPILELIDGAPRAVSELSVSDELWLRLADLGPALELRGYAQPVDVRIAVTDTFAEWNAGTWRLTVDDDGRATCTRTDQAPDLSLDQAQLAAAYLGTRTLVAQARAGWVTEHTPGTLLALSRAMMSSTRAFGAVDF